MTHFAKTLDPTQCLKMSGQEVNDVLLAIASSRALESSRDRTGILWETLFADPELTRLRRQLIWEGKTSGAYTLIRIRKY